MNTQNERGPRRALRCGMLLLLSGSLNFAVQAGCFDTEIKLTASDGGRGDGFGNTVAIDGDTLVVGADYDDNFAGTGSVYVFVRNGSGWVEQTKLMASDPGRDQWFGWSVAISGDTIVVGSPGVADVGYRSGAAYVFVRSEGTWTQQARLTASDNAAGLYFGLSTGISGDTLVVGAEGDAHNGAWSGAAYVFERTGAAWSQKAKLYPQSPTANDYFGYAAAVEGETIVIGAAEDDPARTGAVYVFVRTINGWTQQAKLVPSDGKVGNYFGTAVGISGNAIVAGSYFGDAAYVFQRDGSSWTEQVKLVASDGQPGDHFGSFVAINGPAIVAGAFLQNGWAGSAYVFTYNGTSWIQQQKLVGSDTASGDHYGLAVGISGNHIVIGAYAHPTQSYIGAAYVYESSVDTTPPVISAPAAVVVNTDARKCEASNVALGTPVTSDNCGVASVVNNAPAIFPKGVTTVTWTVTDTSGNTATATQTVTVNDTEKPVITSLTATPDVLWPPNHKLVPVAIAVSATDNCDSAPVTRITGVTCNDPAAHAGDDWLITGYLTVNLRADRLGNTGDRVYTIKVSCTDAAGNVRTGTTNVTVPHDRKLK